MENGDGNPEPERAVKKRRETWKKNAQKTTKGDRNLGEFGKTKDQ
jgi:hypothetical protein